MKKLSIVFVNVHWSNHGDEAALVSILDCIKDIRKDIDITLLIKDSQTVDDTIISELGVKWESNKFLPKYFDYFIQLFTKGKIGSNKEMKHYFSILNSADYIFYAPGGAVICDRFWWRKQLEYLAPFYFSKLYRKPMMVVAPSVGPFDKKYKFRNWCRKNAFDVPNPFLVRENNSQKQIENIGTNNIIKTTVDSAFCSKVKFNVQQDILKSDKKLMEFFLSHRNIVGVTVTDLQWNVKFKNELNLNDKIYSAMLGFIKYLQMNNIGIVLIPQLFSNQNDKSLLQNYKIGDNIYILDENYDSQFQQYIISKLNIMVGMRYHSNIFAAKMGVPFLPIVYEEKMDYFLKNTYMDSFKIYVEELTTENLKEKYEKILTNYDTYKTELKNNQFIWNEKANLTISSIKEFLS